jgi:glutathione S-transferase
MILYTCTDGKSLAAIGHPCAKAAKALDEAGHSYEMKQVKGGRLKFWTWSSRSSDRAEIKQLSGQEGVPILVLDDGEVISGSGKIVSWAQQHAPAAAGSAAAS